MSDVSDATFMSDVSYQFFFFDYYIVFLTFVFIPPPLLFSLFFLGVGVGRERIYSSMTKSLWTNVEGANSVVSW